MEKEIDTIKDIIQTINECWKLKDYEGIGSYLPGDTKVDLIGDTAVAICPFEVVYKLQGANHHEQGQNILVFAFSQGSWKIVWRTMMVEAITEKFD